MAALWAAERADRTAGGKAVDLVELLETPTAG